MTDQSTLHPAARTPGPLLPERARWTVKHSGDRVFAALALLALSPLLLVLALSIKASSPGPVLYRQRRLGRDGEPFDILKFRSMAPAPAPNVAYLPTPGCAPGGVEGDDRRTGVGRLMRRTSLDELPQLVNVLRGEMSVVGPRPERPEFAELFSAEIDRYAERHRVRGGMTGWAQIQGLRGQTSIADRVEADNWYIDNHSLWLDVKTVALTMVAVTRPAD